MTELGFCAPLDEKICHLQRFFQLISWLDTQEVWRLRVVYTMSHPLLGGFWTSPVNYAYVWLLVMRGHLVCVESPEVELLFEQRTAHVGRVVQLPGAIVVEDLREDARMSVEEVLVEYRVVVGQRLGETGQARGRDLLQRRLVRLVTDATHVDDDAVVGVRHGHRAAARYNTEPARSSQHSQECRDPRRQGFAAGWLRKTPRTERWRSVCPVWLTSRGSGSGRGEVMHEKYCCMACAAGKPSVEASTYVALTHAGTVLVTCEFHIWPQNKWFSRTRRGTRNICVLSVVILAEILSCGKQTDKPTPPPGSCRRRG